MNPASPPALPLSKRILVWLAIALGYGVMARVSIEVSQGGGRVAAIWLANAAIVAVGLAWRAPLSNFLAPAFVAHLLSLLLGWNNTPAAAFGLALANAAEIGITLVLARRSVAHPEQIKTPRCLAGFLGIATLAALVSGLIAGFTVRGVSSDMPLFLSQWWLAHALAMATIAPLLLVIEADRRDCRLRDVPLLTLRAALDILLGSIAIALIFSQSTLPVLFLAVPVILVVAARQGSAASAILLLATTLIATWFTTSGYGPIQLAAGSVQLKAGVLQLFVFVTFASTLPVILARERVDAIRERTLTLFETMNEVPFTLDLAGRWTYVSGHWSTVLGRGRPLPLGQRALAIVPEAQRRTVLRAMSSLLSGEVEEAHFEFRANAPSPKPVHVTVRMRLLRKRDRSPDGYVGIITDVSREAERERALADTRQRLTSLAENAPVGIFQLDNDGNAVFLNQAWARMHGMSIEDGLGKGWQAIMDDAHRAHYAAFAAEREAGATTDIEASVQRPDGSRGRIRVVTTALRNADGELTGRLGVVVNQTKEYEAQAALTAALEESRAAVAAKDRFLALMSHELRTPMNGVLGFAERLQESGLDETQQRYVSLIAKSGEIMLALLNDILDTSRMREGQLQLAHKPYDLSAAITGICQHFEPLAARRGLQLRCNFASPLPRVVLGDEQRLTQIMTNLLGNALKFTEAGWISVYARIEPQYDRTILIVEVTDTGIGIAPEDREGIFEAFEQGGGDIAMRFGGTGLGLPIARGLAEQMGGSLRLVTSSLGKGSIFRVTLPLDLPSEGHAPGARFPAAAKAQERPRTGQGLRVLVAEDNEINRHLITDMLADSGCAFTIVPDGQQAVDAVRTADLEARPFDLVLMDLRMPVLDGAGATRAIRALGFTAASLPIIAVTASVHQDAMDACWEAGMQDYVTKPLGRAAIDMVFAKWTRGSAPTPAATAPEPPAPPAIDPELAPLLSRFVDQCRDCLDRVTALLDGGADASTDERRAAQSSAHSLAGLAATFAAPQLVAPAQAADLALDKDEADAFRQPLAHLQRTLQAYLAQSEAKAD